MIKVNLQTIKNAVLSIVKNAVKILRFEFLGKGQTPWVYYEDKQGKRRATFLKKSAFQGYNWNDDYTEVTNLETGEIYQVNAHSCTCKDWFDRVKTGKKSQCKHQIMRSEYVNSVISCQSSVISNSLTQLTGELQVNNTKQLTTDNCSLITEIEDLPPGCRPSGRQKLEGKRQKYHIHHNSYLLTKIPEILSFCLWLFAFYLCEARAWVRKFDGEEYYPASVEIGSIIKTQFSGLEAWTKSAINGITFESVNDAVNYLLRKANINLKETKQAYQYAELGF